MFAAACSAPSILILLLYHVAALELDLISGSLELERYTLRLNPEPTRRLLTSTVLPCIDYNAMSFPILDF